MPRPPCYSNRNIQGRLETTPNLTELKFFVTRYNVSCHMPTFTFSQSTNVTNRQTDGCHARSISATRGDKNSQKHKPAVKVLMCGRYYSIQQFLPRDSYAKRGICRRRVSVCVSVTLRYCIKTAKRRITQITPHDSSVCVSSFLTPKFTAKVERDHSLRGRQMQVGSVKIRHFRQKTRYNSKTVQDRRIVSIKVE